MENAPFSHEVLTRISAPAASVATTPAGVTAVARPAGPAVLDDVPEDTQPLPMVRRHIRSGFLFTENAGAAVGL